MTHGVFRAPDETCQPAQPVPVPLFVLRTPKYMTLDFTSDIPESLCVGAWRIDAPAFRLHSDAKTIKVPPKVMAVLLCLVKHQGKVVSKDALMAGAWSGMYVSQSTIRRTISELRQALEQDPQHSPYIETIPKGGYQLLAPVVTHQTLPSPRIIELGASPLVAPCPPSSQRQWVIGITGFVTIQLLIWWGIANRSSETPVIQAPPVRITQARGVETRPRLSPDGHHVAYLHLQNPMAPQRISNLYVTLISEGTTRALTNDSLQQRALAWSPQGTHIAYLAYGPNACGLYTVALMGSVSRKIKTCHTQTPPSLAWTADGKGIIYARVAESDRPDVATELVRVDLSTFEEVVYPHQELGYHHHPALSPVGNQLAYIRQSTSTSETLDIQLHSLDGDQAPLTLHTAALMVRHIRWSSDGKALYLITTRLDPPTEAWRLDVATGNLTRLPVDLNNNRVYGVDLADNKIVYAQMSSASRIWQLSIDTPTQTSIQPARFNSTGRDVFPQVSPDGQQVAFFSDRRGRMGLWISSFDGSATHELAPLRGLEYSPPQWLQDGRALVYADGGVIYHIETGGGKPTRLSSDDAIYTAPWLSANDIWAYYTGTTPEGPTIWRAHLGTHQIQRVSPVGVHEGLIGMDGNTMFFIRHPNPYQIYQRRVEDSVATPVFDLSTLEESVVIGDWFIKKDGMYVIAASTPSHLSYINFESGKLSLVGDLPFRPHHLTRSPSGQVLLFVQHEERGLDLAMQVLPEGQAY